MCVLVWQRSVSCNASFSDLFLPFPAHQHSQPGAERPAWWGLKVVEGEEAWRRQGLLAAMTRWYLDHDEDEFGDRYDHCHIQTHDMPRRLMSCS